MRGGDPAIVAEVPAPYPANVEGVGTLHSIALDPRWTRRRAAASDRWAPRSVGHHGLEVCRERIELLPPEPLALRCAPPPRPGQRPRPWRSQAGDATFTSWRDAERLERRFPSPPRSAGARSAKRSSRTCRSGSRRGNGGAGLDRRPPVPRDHAGRRALVVRPAPHRLRLERPASDQADHHSTATARSVEGEASATAGTRAQVRARAAAVLGGRLPRSLGRLGRADAAAERTPASATAGLPLRMRAGEP